MINYVNLYKKELEIQFNSSKYEIHHIDLNRKNNKIKNLLLLPRKLHRQYHYYLQVIEAGKKHLNEIKYINGGYPDDYYQTFCRDITSLLEVKKDIRKWADFKMYLEDKLLNIHNINKDDLL
jgi:hypothetical protein